MTYVIPSATVIIQADGTMPKAPAEIVAESPVNTAADSFGYGLHQRVKLVESNETGTIIGRAEYTTSINSYLVRYLAGDGRQVESWWSEGAIIAA